MTFRYLKGLPQRVSYNVSKPAIYLELVELRTTPARRTIFEKIEYVQKFKPNFFRLDLFFSRLLFQSFLHRFK